MYKKVAKPVLDMIFAALFVAVFCWLYVILAIMVRVKLGAPVLFVQERPGKIDKRTGKERIFKLYKFRTMTDERDENGELLADDVRLTKFGKFLRSTSLDELPEVFFNILLTRSMSWVGPRPLLVQYIPRYSKEQRRRHEVMPGLTGYAQVNGRNTLTWEAKFKDDVWYSDHVSFFVDLKIILKTVAVVFGRNGISSDTSATMEEFMGNE